MRKTILATLLIVVAAAPGAHVRAGLAYLSTSRPANSLYSAIIRVVNCRGVARAANANRIWH